MRAADLLADGVVQHVVPEVDDESRRDLAVAVAAEVGARLRELTAGVRHASAAVPAHAAAGGGGQADGGSSATLPRVSSSLSGAWRRF